MNSGRVVPQASQPPRLGAVMLLVLGGRRSIASISCGVPKKTSLPPLSSSTTLWNIWKIFEVGWWIVTSTILLCDIPRMMSMTCSQSFDESPLVGSSKR